MHPQSKVANHKANFCRKLDKTQLLSHLERAAKFHSWVKLSHYHLSDLHTSCFLKSSCPYICNSLSTKSKEIYFLWTFNMRLMDSCGGTFNDVECSFFFCLKHGVHTSTFLSRWRKTMMTGQQRQRQRNDIGFVFLRKHTGTTNRAVWNLRTHWLILCLAPTTVDWILLVWVF